MGHDNIKLSVLMLLMEHEYEATLITLETLLDRLPENVTVSILLNGSSIPELGKLLESFNQVFYYESPVNLGVAGGRNFLLECKECQRADMVMFIDNDVIPTTDIIPYMISFLSEHKEAGVIGSSLLKYSSIVDKYSHKFDTESGPFGNKVFAIDNKTLRSIISKDNSKENFDHIGTDPDYERTYFGAHAISTSIKQNLKIEKRSFEPGLRNSLKHRNFYKDDDIEYFEVTNNAGASQMFRRSLIDEIGLLNEMFSPYGHEDVDFSIKAIKKGYKNYCLTKSFMLHGTDTRHNDRVESNENTRRKEQNKTRVETILHYIHFPDEYKTLMKKRIINHFILDVARNKSAYGFLVARYKGYQKALEQIADSKK